MLFCSRSSQSVLHVGCGNSALAAEMQDYFQFTAPQMNIDFSDVLIEAMRGQYPDLRLRLLWILVYVSLCVFSERVEWSAP